MYEPATLREVDPRLAGAPVGTAPATTPGVFDLLGAVLRHKLSILLCAALGTAAAVAFVALATPRYTATTQIIVDPTDLRVVDNSLHATAGFSDAQIAQVEDQVRVLTSSTVLQRVVEAEHLDQDPEFVEPGSRLMRLIGSMTKTLLGGAAHREEPVSPEQKAIRALEKKVTAAREERTFVVDVAVSSRRPENAARLADAVVAAFLEVSAESRNDAARRVADSLRSRLGDLKQSVETAEQKVVDFKKQHNLVAAVGQNVTEQQLANASIRLGQARNEVSDAQSRFDQVIHSERNGDPGAIPEALQSTAVSSLRTQLADVLRKEGNLAATLGARHPMMAEMRAQEQSVRALIREEISRIAAVSKGNLARAKADLQAAEASFHTLEASVTSKNALSVRLAELERDAQASRTVYESFLTRTREVGQQEDINSANISVISPAQVPETRSFPPKPPLLVLAGLIGGLGLGIALALAREFMLRDRSGILIRYGWPAPVEY